MPTPKVAQRGHAAAIAIIASFAFGGPIGLAQQTTNTVPQEEIENTYRAKNQGEALYRAGKYEEALPYLRFAAERGFKESQSQLGSIYVNGLGGVEQDLVQGVGWLGVAASGKTEPDIKKLYKKIREQIPAQHNATLDDIVQKFKQNYDGSLTRVVCELVSRAATNTKELRCRFLDEGNYPSLRINIR